MTLDEMINAWIDDSGMRVEPLAKSLGLSRNTLYKWMNGESRPTLRNLDRLGTELGKGSREKSAAVAALLEAQGA